jgi:hypothetical protein
MGRAKANKERGNKSSSNKAREVRLEKSGCQAGYGFIWNHPDGDGVLVVGREAGEVMIEPYPLVWPDGWPRTLLRDRQERKAWKDSIYAAAEKLRKELHRSKALSFVITCNIPPAGKNYAQVPEPADTGVAVWFSREHKDDYSWQEVLRISSPSPSEKEITDAFKSLAGQYHPDKGGDLNIYMRYDEARKNALDFIARKTGTTYGQSVAIDTFNSVRLNMQAIRMALGYMRGLELCGAPSILERAFEGFAAIPERVSGK